MEEKDLLRLAFRKTEESFLFQLAIFEGTKKQRAFRRDNGLKLGLHLRNPQVYSVFIIQSCEVLVIDKE
jgi:hypothetical protein